MFPDDAVHQFKFGDEQPDARVQLRDRYFACLIGSSLRIWIVELRPRRYQRIDAAALRCCTAVSEYTRSHWYQCVEV